MGINVDVKIIWFILLIVAIIPTIGNLIQLVSGSTNNPESNVIGIIFGLFSVAVSCYKGIRVEIHRTK